MIAYYDGHSFFDSIEVRDHFTLLELLIILARIYEQSQFEMIKAKDIIISNTRIELTAWRERALTAEKKL